MPGGNRGATGERTLSLGSTVVLGQIEPLSLVGLRTRPIRYLLAGAALLAFLVTYFVPIVEGIRTPSVPAPLSRMELPLLAFPRLASPAPARHSKAAPSRASRRCSS